MLRKSLQAHYEKIIGTTILLILVIITIGLLVKQSKYDISNFGMISAKTSRGSGLTIDISGIDMTKFQPKNYKLLLEREKYDRENLHEKINGKATLYIDSGFLKMVSQRFVSVNDKNNWIELYIYDMANFKYAFSVYSQQKRADAGMVPGQELAYITSNSLYKVKGRYYIEILGSKESKEIRKALSGTSLKINTKFSSSVVQELKELIMFDKNYLISGSEKLFLKSAFGYEGLKNIYTARYKLKGKEVTVFISIKKSRNDAVVSEKNYLNFLKENGGTAKESKILKDLAIIDLYGSYETVFSRGNILAGIHEADSQKIAEEFASLLIDKINKEQTK